MRFVLLLGLFGLTACGTSVDQITLASGQPAYEMHCGGLFETKIDCNLTASEICPGGGYEPLDSRTGRLTVVCVPRHVAASKPI
jgi:hypothetical protein